MACERRLLFVPVHVCVSISGGFAVSFDSVGEWLFRVVEGHFLSRERGYTDLRRGSLRRPGGQVLPKGHPSPFGRDFNWQGKPEGRAATGITLDPNAALVLLDECPTQI
jgi:hypothetical protein